jgi:hypothetical protein
MPPLTMFVLRLMTSPGVAPASAPSGSFITVLPGRRYPDLINDDNTLLENSFTVPDAARADVPASQRGPAELTRGATASGGNGGVPRVPFVKA